MKNNIENYEFEPVRIDGKTPAGGDYALFYHYDENHKACKPEEAYWIHIHEYTASGKFIHETIGFGAKAPL
ncbi:MAG: hypothetical protein E7496_08065 [Ruminococcus sp.]|nr:hypothetical protein [Ruminococcus sp.]